MVTFEEYETLTQALTLHQGDITINPRVIANLLDDAIAAYISLYAEQMRGSSIHLAGMRDFRRSMDAVFTECSSRIDEKTDAQNLADFQIQASGSLLI